jgi:hypothetical protein
MQLIYETAAGAGVVIPGTLEQLKKKMMRLKCPAQLINDDGACIGTVEWCDYMDAGPGWSWCIEV